MSARLAVEITGLECQQGGFRLRDLNLRLPVGQVLALVGVSGAGKTTAVNAVIGTLPAERGRVRVLGDRVSPDNREVVERLGIVPGHVPFRPQWWVARAVSFLAGTYPRWDETWFLELCDCLDVPVAKRVGQLQPAQTARLMLVLALSHYPELLIVDQPVDTLSQDTDLDVSAMLREYVRERGASVLFCARDPDEVRWADHVHVLRRGRTMWSGTRARLAREFATVRGGRSALTSDVRRLAWALRVSARQFEGLIRREDISMLRLDPGVAVVNANLSQAVALLCRGQRGLGEASL